MSAIGTVTKPGVRVAPFVAIAVAVWVGLGVLYWHIVLPPPPPSLGQETDPRCAACEDDRRKWQRLSTQERGTTFIYHVIRQAICWAKGCQFRLAPTVA